MQTFDRYSILQLLRSALVNNATQAQIYKDIGIAEFVFKKEDVQTQPKERADYVEGIHYILTCSIYVALKQDRRFSSMNDKH